MFLNISPCSIKYKSTSRTLFFGLGCLKTVEVLYRGMQALYRSRYISISVVSQNVSAFLSLSSRSSVQH